jgi:probable rRNA maturation factor
VNTRLLRQLTSHLLTDLLAVAEAELGVTLLGAKEMARINWQYLQHEGSTDVITFDHTEAQESRLGRPDVARRIHGELFICLEDAKSQAREFRTVWEMELVRYIVHGVLHLLGHDDHRRVARARMKREENRLVRQVAQRYPLGELRR